MVEPNGLLGSVEVIVMAPLQAPAGSAVTATVSVAGVCPWGGLTVSQPAGPESMVATAVKGTDGVLVILTVCVTGITNGIAVKAMLVVGVTKGNLLLVKVTSVKPEPKVGLMELPPVAPVGETTLVTL